MYADAESYAVDVAGLPVLAAAGEELVADAGVEAEAFGEVEGATCSRAEVEASLFVNSVETTAETYPNER